MKYKVHKMIRILIIPIVAMLFISCGGGGDDDAPVETLRGNLGSFEGLLQVTDDPQTNLGYVFDATIEVERNGSEVEILVNGDFGLNRSFTGEITGSAPETGTYLINILEQNSPNKFNVGGNIGIGGNELTFTTTLPDATISLKKTEADTTTFDLSGRLRISGVSMIKND